MKTREEIQKKVAQEIQDITFGQVNITDSGNSSLGLISDLGLDSLDYAALMVSVEEWLDVKVPEGNVDWNQLASADQFTEFMFSLQKGA